MTSYEEYCPIAVGVEYFGDRWTPLILRELVVGSHRFNDIHRGIPKISRTLLSQRLRSLVDRGLVDRLDDGGIEYHLTPAGADLEPIIWALGHWAARWAFGDPEKAQLDIAWLVWRMRQHLDPEHLPAPDDGGVPRHRCQRWSRVARGRPQGQHRVSDRSRLRGRPPCSRKQRGVAPMVPRALGTTRRGRCRSHPVQRTDPLDPRVPLLVRH